MDILTLFGVAWALAMDAFAVAAAVAAGLPRLTARHTFRLAWHFGFFQAAMPVLGWMGGNLLSRVLTAVAPWVAFGLLGALGVRMIWNSGQERKRNSNSMFDPTRGWSLVGLSIATSIDALSVGITLGLLRVSIWMPAGIIGLFTIALTYLGARIGHKAGNRLGRWADRIGGIVLISIGVRILIIHVAGTW